MPIYRIYVAGLPRERGFYVVEAADDRAAVRRAREHHGQDGIIEIEAGERRSAPVRTGRERVQRCR